ncbi:hypothetical protein TBLA_0E01920 [Henningerozyma blattae CBS 6284]|uniref:Kinetochore-associated protein MTW1 n=1 Tax=Henningerozyma blattae (strain ATCC 34711 / CBS 6284 / DSM 70876 / NBRC 10599 / NRRL Y-10934 / UCD 77-7) TaxID=1071380 RepID=I2H4E4_HENB6|nr:hypothetical protein TBLA_0E01920 [Tetrapisispora blattae CBS 6284]CCH61246.1 hypothetical protein TBLA_0E01920 [Tetrapisispora blattae CBS 6284]
MSTPASNSMDILTEYLGFPPISLIDDILNFINETMLKCTFALETYLMSHNVVDGIDYSNEISSGIEKYENILTKSIDKNFDKLELYLLRNVLHIPQDIVNADSFRSVDQMDLNYVNEFQKNLIDSQIKDKLMEITELIESIRSIKLQILKLNKLKVRIMNFKDILNKILSIDPSINADKKSKMLLESISPIKKTIKLLINELKELVLINEENSSLERIRDITNTQSNLLNSELTRNNYLSSTLDTVKDSKMKDSIVDANSIEQDNGHILPKISNPRLDLL